MSSPTMQVATYNLAKDLEFWMTNLPQCLRNIPIIQLAIPGSHDSFTSSITSKSKIAPDAEKILTDLQCFGRVVTTITSKWSKTQSLDVIEQLKSGIRYFDLRIATKEGTNDFYFVHGLYADKVEQVLNDILYFVKSHPNEVVILDCQHFYAFTPTDHTNLMRLLMRIFGSKCAPYTPQLQQMTLEYLTYKFHYQIIIIYRLDAACHKQPMFWPSASFPTPWPNTVSVSELISKLNDGLIKRNFNVGYVSQCILTPTPWFVCKNLLSNLRNKCVIPLEKAKYEWLKRQKPGQAGINIVISDFIDIDMNKFAKEVIELNMKLLNEDNIRMKQYTDHKLTPIS